VAEQVQVTRRKHATPDERFGPFSGYRIDDVVAYEFELYGGFEPRPGSSRADDWPITGWSDFPPRAIEPLLGRWPLA